MKSNLNNRLRILKGIGRRYRAAMDKWDYVKADHLLSWYYEISLFGK